MASSPSRGDLSVWLKDTLTSEGLLVGLLKVPPGDEPGWNDDPAQPGAEFTPYVVLTPMDAGPAAGSLADPHTEWNMPYSIRSIGVMHSQVEGQADKARRIVNEIKRVSVTLDGEPWKVIDCRVNSIGGVDIDRQVSPNEFSQRDVITVRISKRRA